MSTCQYHRNQSASTKLSNSAKTRCFHVLQVLSCASGAIDQYHPQSQSWGYQHHRTEILPSERDWETGQDGNTCNNPTKVLVAQLCAMFS